MHVDHDRPYIIEVRDILSAAECLAMIARIEALNPEIATINTAAGTRVRTDVRNNERVMFDDPELAALLYERVKPKAPPTIYSMSLVGVNERFRCYRYKPGMRFAPHVDGAFERNESEFSCYTFMVYLNADFDGGHTTFFTVPQIAIKPEIGKGLLFQHPILHEGSLVNEGVKYVVRTDLMYRTVAA